jgi:hypothetical protein
MTTSANELTKEFINRDFDSQEVSSGCTTYQMSFSMLAEA